jgi:hypothetical protein
MDGIHVQECCSNTYFYAFFHHAVNKVTIPIGIMLIDMPVILNWDVTASRKRDAEHREVSVLYHGQK